MYLWERPEWPEFTWQTELLQPRLDAVRLLQGRVLGQSELLPAEAARRAGLDALVDNTRAGAALAGEPLVAESLRAAVARRFGADQGGPVVAEADALVDLLLDAGEDTGALTAERLARWQAAVVPLRAGLRRGSAGGGVPPHRLEAELDEFIAWFNHSHGELDPLLRAGIAHLWLLALRPFEDGNGRVGRAVTDLALAQAEAQSTRFCALGAVLLARRDEYLAQLEAVQSGDLYLTFWLDWFLEVVEEALQGALGRFRRVLASERLRQRHVRILNPRQLEVLNHLVDEGTAFRDGISAGQYRLLTGSSKPTATRDLADLVAKGCLQRLPAGGRSTRYVVVEG